MLKNSDIAKALGVTPQRVIALRKRGMPDGPDVTLEQIVEWRRQRLESNQAQVSAPTIAPAQDGAAAGTLEERIARHQLRVDEAERVWQAAMLSGDGNSSKYQTAYNQSLKTLVALQNEAFERQVRAREYVRRSEAEELALGLCQLFINATDSAPDSLADLCNPDNPAKARKAIELWAIVTRRNLSEKVAGLGDQQADG